MISKIKILKNQEIQKIAAGEVVERPVNVLKELIENSLDAQATSIVIYLEEAGKNLIRIIDNGIGMSNADAKLCFEHHATSKIDTFNDLCKIDTFGFRGEALSSIASVSKLKLITKQETDQLGICLDIEQNRLEKESFVNCNVGTELAIKDLFFNVPARKKFLKSKETEYRSIISLFHAFCFSYTNINFKLYHDNKLIYNCPAVSSLIKRFGQLHNYDIAQNIIELNADNIDNTDSLKQNPHISGIISDPKYSRYDRSQIYLFVNKRWVKNYKLVQAFIKGYQGILETSRFPLGVINIFADKEEVDINIHPKKEEVQFLHPRIIENLITNSIKKNLENNLNKSLNFKSCKELQENNQEFKQETNLDIKGEVIPKNKDLESKYQEFIDQQSAKLELEIKEVKKEEIEYNQEFNYQELNLDIKNINYIKERGITENTIDYKLIVQVLKTYILIEVDTGLTLIDQHAAHERIIYQKIQSNFINTTKIKLLFAEFIELSAEDILILTPYLELFDQCGITIEQISANSVVVKEVPIFLKNIVLKDIIYKSVALIKENSKLEKYKLNNLIKEKIHAQISCKAAIKANEILQIDTMHNIIKELYNAENKLTCPHGRPTLYNLTIYDIEKFFKRNYKQKIDNLFL